MLAYIAVGTTSINSSTSMSNSVSDPGKEDPCIGSGAFCKPAAWTILSLPLKSNLSTVLYIVLAIRFEYVSISLRGRMSTSSLAEERLHHI